MAERIAASDIAAVRDRVRIDEVVAAHVTLKNAGGGSMKGLCPFHDERSPSFHVTPSKGLFYCFGCGAGGDAINFLMSVEHLSFHEAVDKLAGRAGIQLRYESGDSVGPTPQEAGLRSRVLAVNAAAAAWFSDQLPVSGPATEFLTSRGFPSDTWDRFSVGYAPRAGLLPHLRGHGFSDDVITAAGLTGTDPDTGRSFERFRDRVMWPIRDASGDIVGFGGRRLDDGNGPKYLNTPETVAYKKSQVLYGLYEARRDIAKQHHAVIVEGYTDVMACHLAGVTTAVATCGTAFGSGHVTVLRRLLLDDTSAQVVFTFDGDSAGQKAALRAYDEDQAFAARTYVAVAADGLDPCDLRLRDGDDALHALVATRTPLFEFALRHAVADLDMRTAEGRSAGLAAVAPIIAGLKDPTLRPEYARQVAGWLGTDAAHVERAVTDLTRRSARPRAVEPDNTVAMMDTVEQYALQAILQRPLIAADWLPSITTDAFATPALQGVYTAVLAAGEPHDGPGWVAAVTEQCRDPQQAAVMRALTSRPLPLNTSAQGSDDKYVIGVLARLLDQAADRTATALRVALNDAADRDDSTHTGELLTDLMSVEEYRRSLRVYWTAVD